MKYLPKNIGRYHSATFMDVEGEGLLLKKAAVNFKRKLVKFSKNFSDPICFLF